MQHKRVLAITLLMALVASACGSSGPTAEQLEAATELTNSVDDLQGVVDHTSGEMSALEASLDATSEAVSGFVASGQTHAIDRTAGIPDPPEGQVAVRISFAYLPDALPGNGVLVYEPLADVSTVWAMESLEAGQEIPIGDALEGQTVFITPGEKQAVTLAYENPSEASVHFLAVPHQDSPGGLNAMIWPQCLCFSYPYEAPAQGGWYRVIELTASPDLAPGSKIDLQWTLLTDESVFPES